MGFSYDAQAGSAGSSLDFLSFVLLVSRQLQLKGRPAAFTSAEAFWGGIGSLCMFGFALSVFLFLFLEAFFFRFYIFRDCDWASAC